MGSIGLRAGAIALALLLAGLAAPAQARCVAHADDERQVLDLLTRYDLYTDAHDGKALASLFTPDGEWIVGDQVVTGRPELEKRVSGLSVRNFHMTSRPILLWQDAGKARARSEVLYVVSSDPAPTLSLAASRVGFGVFEDDLVRTPAGWKFARRRFATQIPLSPEWRDPPADALC